MTDILVRPQELRQTAQQLRASAKKISDATGSVGKVVLGSALSLVFSGNRASALMQRYRAKEGELAAFDDLVVKFANDLEQAANRFEQADKQGFNSSDSARTLSDVQERIKELKKEYANTLQEIYDLLNQAMEKDKSMIKGMASLIFSGLKAYFKGEISLDAAIGMLQKSGNVLSDLESSGKLDSRAVTLMDKLSNLGTEINKESYTQAYMKLDGQDMNYLKEEKEIIEENIRQVKEQQAELERLVTSWDGHSSVVLGEFTGQVDGDALTKQYIQAMQHQRQYELELAAVNRRLSEINN
jgi:uncharacterized protein YukE